MQPTHPVTIIKAIDGVFREAEDFVASETAVALLVNGEHLVSLLASPTELDCLGIGFLISEGLIQHRKDLVAVEVNEQNASVSVTLAALPANWQQLFHTKTLTSGCGKGITFSDASRLRSLPMVHGGLTITPGKIMALLSRFNRASALFKETGGVHSAAFADQEEILLFSEDIGRHNAVDKVIGKAFLGQVPLGDKILLSSGRISGEIMTKMIANRIPILISRSAPTCMSVTQAEDHGITLIGFARANRLNIYSHPQRVAAD